MRGVSKALLATAALIGAVSFGVSAAQTPTVGEGYKTVQGPHTLNPGDWPAHYPFADETEAAVAASEVHHVRYVDRHVRLVEVAYFPGVIGNMHGHPYPSVFAVDAPVPRATNTPLDPAHNMVAAVGPPPEGTTYPYCRSASPQNPHHESNQDEFPHHFYRLEFLRLDGSGLRANWKTWYPNAVSASDRTRWLYEDDHIRLTEVLVRPGERQSAPASSYPYVMAFDAGGDLVPRSKGGHESPALAGFETLGCATGASSPSLVTRNTGAVPIHYYRIEFKRIDGDGIKDHWRDWYPWMASLKDAYDRSPNTPNF